jgi:hypothetical protein
MNMSFHLTGALSYLTVVRKAALGHKFMQVLS